MSLNIIVESISHLLDETKAFASTGHGISVKINEVEFPKRLKNLLDVRLCKVEVEGADIYPKNNDKAWMKRDKRMITHCILP